MAVEETATHNPWAAGRTSPGARGPKFPITKAGRMEIRTGGIPGWVQLMVPLRCLGSCLSQPCSSTLSPPQSPAGAGVAGLQQTLLAWCPPAPWGCPWLLLPAAEALQEGLRQLFLQEQPHSSTHSCCCFCFAKPGRAGKKHQPEQETA